MRVTVKGTNIKVTERMRNEAEKRLAKLERYKNFLDSVVLVYRVQRAWHVVEITCTFRDTILRAEERATDQFAAIDAAVDRIEEQVKRLKGRILARKRRAREQGRVERELEELIPEEEEEELEEPAPPRVVRTKSFSTTPMSTEEAIWRMEMLGHDFFVFVQEEDGEVNVVYRREDGDYGLMRPEK